MARDTDRKKISEALRTQNPILWDVESRTLSSLTLVTDYDERLHIQYGRFSQVKGAVYTHWDRDTGDVVSAESITHRKRERVLHLINQGGNR